MAQKVAIIGAGLAGLSCARTLRRAGMMVDVFEKDGSIGGRIATTRVGGDRFDHGAQYLSAKSDEFRGYLEEAASSGHAARWTPRVASEGRSKGPVEDWFVGKPGMSSVVRPIAESVRVIVGRRAQSIERREKGWYVWFEDETAAGPFDAVAVTIPAAQARRLFGPVDALTASLSRVRMLPCWALMVRIEAREFPEYDVLSEVSDVIHWIARDNTKPGRDPDGATVVVQASPFWSLAAEHADPAAVAEDLWSGVSEALDLSPVRPARMSAYLWREGLVDRPLGETHLYSPELQVGLAGDWCLGGRAEDAFQSGQHLGKAIIASLGTART